MTYLILTAEDNSDYGDGIDHVMVVSVPSIAVKLIHKFVDELNEALSTSEDNCLVWKVEEVAPIAFSALEFASHMHQSDGTGLGSIDKIYRDLIRKHFDPDYNGTCLPGDEYPEE